MKRNGMGQNGIVVQIIETKNTYTTKTNEKGANELHM